MTRNPVLDGIRGIAILFVLIYHTIMISDLVPANFFSRIFHIIASELYVGVDLFFVLSGFLITGILLRNRESKNYYSHFYIRRTLRIFPLYYLFVVLMFIVLPRIFSEVQSLQEIIPLQGWFWAYAQNIEFFAMQRGPSILTNHTWSLAVEEQFYLIWPFVVAQLSTKSLTRISLVLFGTGFIARGILIATHYDPKVLFVLTPLHLDGLMLGAVLAIFTHQKISKIKLAQISKRMIMIGLILRAIVTKFGVTYTFARYALYTSFWSLVFAGVLGLALCSSPGDRLYRILSSKILIFFGAYSYGIYLIHQPVFVLLDRTKDMSSFGPTMTWLWIGGVGSLITLPCAVLIYKFFEKRFLDLKPN